MNAPAFYIYQFQFYETIVSKILFLICSQSDEIFSNTFNNPMYGSVAPKKDYSFESNSTTLGGYVLQTSSVSEVDDEGYLQVSKGRLSFDESEDDRIYEEIKS